MLEKGLSDNTRESYLDDVNKLKGYIGGDVRLLRDVSLDSLHNLIAELHDLGIAPSSQARIISGIKSFFRFLLLEGYIEENPSILLETPRMGRHLPEVLTVNEIDEMISCIDMSSPEGQRNRAIMETLYGCGLRVSELVNLEMAHVFLDEQYIIVRGKGGKERMVPMSEVSVNEINLYLEDRARLDIKPGLYQGYPP